MCFIQPSSDQVLCNCVVPKGNKACGNNKRAGNHAPLAHLVGHARHVYGPVLLSGYSGHAGDKLSQPASRLGLPAFAVPGQVGRTP